MLLYIFLQLLRRHGGTVLFTSMAQQLCSRQNLGPPSETPQVLYDSYHKSYSTCTAYCIWSVISSFLNLNRWSSSPGLVYHIPLKRDRGDWVWRLRLNDTPNAICFKRDTWNQKTLYALIQITLSASINASIRMLPVCLDPYAARLLASFGVSLGRKQVRSCAMTYLRMTRLSHTWHDLFIWDMTHVQRSSY